MRTVKRSAFTALTAGVGIVGWLGAGLLVSTIQGAFDPKAAMMAGTFAAVGLGAVAVWAMRLPAWARTRREQMEGIAARLTAYLRENSLNRPSE